jgi:monofunctional biosynthetic peptidoglycan transglycosylase
MIRRLVRRVVRLFLWLLAALLVCVVAYRFIPPPLTPLMVIRVVEGALAGRHVGIARDWVGLEQVSPALVRAVIAAEDARFFTHRGVDLRAARRARQFNLQTRGRRLRGASTITMQCARNVFLWPERSWPRKALEVAIAVLLEAAWGKRRILEVYLNVVEWGDGLYGAAAAADQYFGVPADALDARQAALLTAALPSPRRSNPALPSSYLLRRAATIEGRAQRVDLTPLQTTWDLGRDAGATASSVSATRRSWGR